MKQYYLHNGQHLLGPFTPDELKHKNISRETLVWNEAQSDWMKADNIPALANIFNAAVPQFGHEFLSVANFPKA